MAACKIVKSFLILFSLVFIVKDGFCAPTFENVTLDNGTVLTMVIHDAVKPPPPKYGDELNTDSKGENEPVIIIHEPQPAPTPRSMSKRSADGDGLDENIGDLQYPPSPRAANAENPTEASPANIVAAGGPTTKASQKRETENAESKVTSKVTELPKSAGNENDAGTSNGEDADDDEAGEDEDETGKDEDEKAKIKAAPIVEPTKTVNKSDDGLKDESIKPEATKEDSDPENKNTDKDDNNPDDAKGKSDSENKETDKDDTITDDDAKGNKDTDKDGKVLAPVGLLTISTDAQGGSSTKGNTTAGATDATKARNGTVEKVTPEKDAPTDGQDPDSDDGDYGFEDDENNIDKSSVGKLPDKVSDADNLDEKIADNVNDNIRNDENANDDYDSDDDDDADRTQNAENKTKFEGTGEDQDDDGDDQDTDKDENYNQRRPPNSGEQSETGGSENLKKSISETQSSGHFMSYFLIAVVFVACFYLIFHNRQKIKAYIVEGKTGRGRRRKAGDSEYRQLSTAEEVLPSPDKGIDSKITYTY